MANEKISQMPAISSFATGDLLAIVDVSEFFPSDRNKSVTFGELFRNVLGGTAAAPSIAFTGDQNTGIYSPGADQVSFTTGGSQRLLIDSSGQIEAASLGSASAPAWSFVGDPNTGIYSPGADQLAISTNGAGRLFVNASGNVGIGTGAPGVLLDISSSAASSSFAIRNSSNTSELQQNGSDFYISNYTASGPIVFRAGSGSERMRLDSSGRLGLGTSSPAVLFHAVGAGLFRGSTTGTPADLPTETTALSVLHGTGYNTAPSCSINIGANNRDAVNNNEGFRWGITTPGDATGLALAFSSTSWNGSANVTSERLRITDAGNVGIGTTSAGRTLSVDNGIQISNSTSGWALGNGFEFTHELDGESNIINRRNAPIRFHTNGLNERCRITNDGKLLLGTSSSTGAGSTLQVRNDASAAAVDIYRSAATTGTSILGINKSRGTAASPSIVAADDVMGYIAFRGHDGSSYIDGAYIHAAVDGTPGTSDLPSRLVFSTTADGASSPTERVRIANTGAVGLSGANYGTAGQVIKSQGSSAAPVWGNAIDYQEFLASGTWAKPAGAIAVYVEIVGGGGGGGSGERRDTTSIRAGGGGGAGGLSLNKWFSASGLGSTISVTVGAGGAGGAAVTTNATNGNNGADGGASSFGTLLESGTAGGGRGANLFGGNGGSLSNRATLNGIFASSGGQGTQTKTAVTANNTVNGGAGGGGGNGQVQNTTASTTGGNGGVVTTLASSMTGASPGASAVANEGGGGGGANYVTATAGMSGGAGAFPGGGGGGGAGSDNGFNSGPGGAGGAGVVRVWSF